MVWEIFYVWGSTPPGPSQPFQGVWGAGGGEEEERVVGCECEVCGMLYPVSYFISILRNPTDRGR